MRKKSTGCERVKTEEGGSCISAGRTVDFEGKKADITETRPIPN